MRYSAGKNWFIFASAALGVFGAALPLSAQLNLGADVVTAVMESESRDKKAGDRAFAAKDYAVAASFYGKYLSFGSCYRNGVFKVEYLVELTRNRRNGRGRRAGRES